MGPMGVLARRSVAAPAAVVAAAVGLGLAFMRDAWQYNTLAATDWASGGLVLMLPILVGAAAFDGWRWWKGALGELMAPTMRARRGLLSLAGAHIAAACGSWILTVGVANSVALVRGATWQFDVFMVVHPLALVAAGAAAGVMLGASIARPWVAPALAVLVFLATVVAENSPSFQGFLTEGGHTSWSPFVRYLPWLALAKAGAWLIVGASAITLAFALEAARDSATRRRRFRASRALAVAGGLTMMGLAFTQPLDTSGLVEREPSVACVGSAPELCAASEEAWIANRYREPLASAYRALARYGVTPPERVVDARLAHGPNPSVGTGDLGASSLTNGSVTDDAVAQIIARPALCPAYFGDGSDPLLVVSDAVLQWAILTLHDPDTGASWHEAYPDVSKATVDAWIPGAYQALLHCDATGVSLEGVIQ